MPCPPERCEQALTIITDQLALEDHQRRKDRQPIDIVRARLEAYSAIVKTLTDRELPGDVMP